MCQAIRFNLDETDLALRLNRRGVVPIILILISIFVLVVLFGLFISGRFFLPRPAVTDVYWTAEGERVYTVQVNAKVKAHVFLATGTEFSGEIVIKIKRDLRFWPDSELTRQTFSVSMAPDSVREFTMEFYPDRTSQGQVRGYYVEVDFPFGHGRWTMENTYPPRLNVLPRD